MRQDAARNSNFRDFCIALQEAKGLRAALRTVSGADPVVEAWTAEAKGTGALDEDAGAQGGGWMDRLAAANDKKASTTRSFKVDKLAAMMREPPPEALAGATVADRFDEAWSDRKGFVGRWARWLPREIGEDDIGGDDLGQSAIGRMRQRGDRSDPMSKRRTSRGVDNPDEEGMTDKLNKWFNDKIDGK